MLLHRPLPHRLHLSLSSIRDSSIWIPHRRTSLAVSRSAALPPASLKHLASTGQRDSHGVHRGSQSGPAESAKAIDGPRGDHVELAAGDPLEEGVEPRPFVAALGPTDALVGEYLSRPRTQTAESPRN
jgi:hypothetical protein